MLRETQSPRPRSPLFRWRTDQRLSQAQAAEQLGISNSLFHAYENAHNLPRPETLRSVEEKTGVKGMGAAMVLYHFGIEREEAECYFRQMAPLSTERS